MVGARGPLPKNLKLGAPDLRAIGPNDVVEETAASKLKPMRPKKPTGLPAVAGKMWDQIVEDLDEAGLIARCDAAALELAVRHYAAAVRASNSLMRTPVTQHDKKNDRSMKNPAAVVFAQHSAEFREYAKLLGLTIVSRARLPVGDQEGGNDGSPFG